MPNRLAAETSPYLQQHADNPVDWYPWGEEALERARREDRPILLSIGYSACHWCHVMEHESFEDEETARIMNEHFVNIKVDREERPDLDSIYMSAVQGMTGHGGWPMTVFLTPDGVPFYGGTYFPPTDRLGMPSFKRVLLGIVEAYRNRRAEVDKSAGQLREFLQRSTLVAASADEPDAQILTQAAWGLVSQFDKANGGFGGAPKFPQPMALQFLLQYLERGDDQTIRGCVETSLRKMAEGGIYDQIGGGFHRYSVDAHWLVPHFEKMLYDNALLSRAYLAAYQRFGDPFYRTVVEETLDYVRREMLSPEGAFYSTQDADSEGEEGKFYAWTPREVHAVLDKQDARVACSFFGITEAGNFEGKSVLHRARSAAQVAAELGLAEAEVEAAIERARGAMFQSRSERVWPGRDEKALGAWNGMMLRSFAEASRVLNRADYREVAERNGTFLQQHLVQGDRVLRSYRDGVAKLDGYLEDYANLADGFLALYEATFDASWFEASRRLADLMLSEFWDEARGGFFDTARTHEELVVRPKDLTDNATPSGNAVAADVLLRLSVLAGEERYRRHASEVFKLVRAALDRYPLAFGRLLCALDFYLSSPKEIALVGDPASSDTQALVDTVYRRYLPNKVVALARSGEDEVARLIPLLADRQPLDGRPTAYVCRNYTCQLPVTDPERLAEQLVA